MTRVRSDAIRAEATCYDGGPFTWRPRTSGAWPPCPDRAAMLTVQLPATAAEQTADRDRQAAALRRQLKKIEASQNALMTELEEAGDGTRPAAEYRQRIRARYRDRAAERAAAEQQLTELETQTAAADDPRSWPPSRVPPASSPPPCPRSARLSTPPWTCRSCTGRTRTR